MRKNWRGGDELLWKNSTLVVTLTNHVIPGPDLHCARPLILWGFLQHLMPKIGEDQEKILQYERGAMALIIW